MKHKIYIVGMGPGEEAMMTMQAYDTLLACDTIIGYQVYLKLLGEAFAEKPPTSSQSKIFATRSPWTFAFAIWTFKTENTPAYCR